MLYEFKCQEHGRFTVKQPMLADHVASCQQCGNRAQRIYSLLKVVWAGSVFRSDGSLRQDEDYAVLKG